LSIVLKDLQDDGSPFAAEGFAEIEDGLKEGRVISQCLNECADIGRSRVGQRDIRRNKSDVSALCLADSLGGLVLLDMCP